MDKNRVGALAGVVFGVAALPLLHLSVVDLENKGATDLDFAAHVADRYISISVSSGLGLLLIAVLVTHISWLSDYLESMAPFGAKVAQAISLISATAMTLSFGFSILTAYGAHENFPDISIRTVAMISESLGTSLVIGLAAFAAVIAMLGWRKKFPSWITFLATIEVALVVVVTAAGIPAAAALATIAWVLINSIGLLLHSRNSA